ncbi:MAG: 6-hydroxymethylpterin diphosphokinase MptE-like protein [Nitrospirota bacterium]
MAKVGQIEYDPFGRPLGIVTIFRLFSDKSGNIANYKAVAPNFFNRDAKLWFKATDDSIWMRGCIERQNAAYEQNKSTIAKWHNEMRDFSWPQADIVFIVGPGPSLKKNAHQLRRIAGIEGVAIIGLNSVAKICPQDLTDFMTADALVPSDCFENLRESTRIWAGIQSNPAICQKNPFWWVGEEKSPFYDPIKREFPNLPTLFTGLTISLSALHLAKNMGANTVVFVGHDACWYDRRGMKTERKIKDMRNLPCWTDEIYFYSAAHLMGAIYWMLVNKVRVINATQRGLLCGSWRNPPVSLEQKRLFEVVDEVRASHGMAERKTEEIACSS